MGITGAVIVIAQFLSSLQSSRVVTDDIRELRQDIEQVRVDHEKYYVKKEELQKVVAKIDQIHKKLTKIQSNTASLNSLSSLASQNHCSFSLLPSASFKRTNYIQGGI